MGAMRTRLVLLLALTAAAVAASLPVAAQAPPLSNLDSSAGWTLDTGKPRPASDKPRRKGASKAAAVSPEEADRAARLAEARRKFFATEPDRRGPDTVHEFGGYDPATMGDGSLRPTAGFKF